MEDGPQRRLMHNDPELFEIIFETIPDGVIMTRAESGEIINVNAGFRRLFGYSKSDAIDRTTPELGLWSDVEDRRRLLSELGLHGSVEDFVSRLRTKSGQVVSVVISAAYIVRNEDRYILADIRDIDPLSGLGQDMGMRRSRYMELVDLLPAALFECDQNLNVTFMNAAGQRALGVTMAAGVVIPLASLLTPILAVNLVEVSRGALQNAMTVRIEVEAHRADGSIFPAHLTLSAVSERPEGSSFLGVLVDLTDRKASRQQLSRLSQAVEQSPSLVLITDNAGHIEYVNRSFTRVTGFTEEEVIGRTPRILKSGVVAESTYRTMWNTILSGQQWKTEILNRKKNGETYWQRSSISPIYNESGSITHFLELAEDITREKELESELFQSQKMEAIGHLAGGIAHDFNNMLTVILGVGEILHSRLEGDQELRDYVESVLSAARKSASLTHQLLAFSRKQLLRPERLDVNSVIRDADKLLKRIVGDNVRIESHLADNLGAALLDQSQLNQIILNLVVNAREAMVGSGKVTITTSRVDLARETIVTSGKLPPRSYVVLSVSDNGCGMDDETLSHLFEPFFTTKSSGTGLGLATVYGIVQQSNGQINVESTLRSGTTFTLYFPLDADGPAAQYGKTYAQSNRFGSETILVVEDDEAVRTFVCDVLESHGYTVLLADSAEHAEEMWSSVAAQTNLLLTDVVLPQKDGVHLFATLRESRADLPVVYMSGYTEDSTSILQEIETGKLLLLKPFGAAQLTEILRRVLDGRVP